MDWIEIGELIGGLILLVLGGDWLVRGAENIAYSFKITPMVVGLTIVAFGTSAPELLVSLKSAFDGSSEIAMGNVVGSNICNLGLVMGLTALFYPLNIQESSIKVDWMMALGSALLMYFFVSRDFSLTQFEGIILVLILCIYTYFLIEMSRKETMEKIKVGLAAGEEAEEIPEVKGMALVKEIGFLVIGCVALFFGADWFVNGSVELATVLGVDKAVIGLTVVAIGTSLPELVTSIVAAVKKNTDMAVGNLIGSNIFNVLSILGITSIVKSIGIQQEMINIDMIWMLAVTLLLLPLMLLRRKIGKGEGLVLLTVYVLYIYYLIERGAVAPL